MEKFFNNPKETFIAFDLNSCQQVKMMMREQSYDFDQYQGFTKIDENRNGELNISEHWTNRLDKNLEGISKILIFIFQNTINQGYIQKLIKYGQNKNIEIVKIIMDSRAEIGDDGSPCYIWTRKISF